MFEILASLLNQKEKQQSCKLPQKVFCLFSVSKSKIVDNQCFDSTLNEAIDEASLETIITFQLTSTIFNESAKKETVWKFHYFRIDRQNYRELL